MRSKFSIRFEKSITVNVMVSDVNEYGEKRTESEMRDAAIEQAVEKHYGKRCFWFVNNGVGWYCGQVFEALRPTKNNSNPGNSSVTKTMTLDVFKNGIRL